MASVPALLIGAFTDRLSRLRFPTLFLLLAGVFLFDLFIPDFIPLVDEVILGLATLLVGALKRDKDENGKDDAAPSDAANDG